MKNDKKLLLALLVFVVCVCSVLIVQNHNLKKKSMVAFSTTEFSDFSYEEIYSSDTMANTTNNTEFPCDINSVSKTTLMQIDGIGNYTAEKIIEYRNQIGEFSSLDQLLNIDGIGTATCEKLKKYLYVGSQKTEKFENIAQTSSETTTITTTQTTTEATTEATTTQETEAIIIEEDIINYPININTAPKKLLMELPGIGEAKASAIITFRQTYGYFNHSDEIMNVKGIGQITYDKIKNLITTGTPQSDIPSVPINEEIVITETTTTEEDVIIVSSKEPEQTEETTTTEPKQLVNINTATKEELISELSLTEEEAEALITHREKVKTGFTHKNEMLLFISQEKYNSIYYKITL